LKKTFRVSQGAAEKKENYFIALDDRAFGEAAGSVFYGPPREKILADLETGAEIFRDRNGVSFNDLEELNQWDLNSASKSALIAAGINHISSASGKYPWEALRLDPPSKMSTSLTIGIDAPEVMAAEIKRSPYPIIKIKMGFNGDDTLLELLKDIQGKLFRIDANGGWAPEKAEKMIYQLNRLNIQTIEQPTPLEYISEWRYIKGKSAIPILIDEGLKTAEDYRRFSDFVDGVNIKMSKSGGALEAIKIASLARKDKRKIMLGCMLESSVGIASAVYISSLADFLDLDGPLLLAKDIASGIEFNLDKINITEDIIGGPKVVNTYYESVP
jgi:L-alanine-DL-glutamate epimerase-like enolase superfamily enzyme